MYLIFILVFLQRAEHLKEIRKLAKQAVAKRIGKRVVKYKNRLRKNLPSQIKIWSEREKRLLAVITGSAGVPIDALLMRECPDPPAEVDPDTDEDETKTDDQTDTLPEGKLDDECDEDDPTTRPWTCKQQGLHAPGLVFDFHPLPSPTQLLRPRWRYLRNSVHACFNRLWQ